jgi:hypothetical protein
MFTKTASRIHTEISKERFAMKNILLSVLISLASVNAKAEINLIPFQYGSENKTTIPTAGPHPDQPKAFLRALSATTSG